MVFSISYDLNKPGQNYDGLYKAIQGLGAWWHYLDSTWLVDTSLTASQVAQRLRAHIDVNDSLLVVGITGESAGWLTEKAWNWIRQHTQQAA